MTRLRTTTAMLMVALGPTPAAACPTCIGQDPTLSAFFTTALLMSVLPLAMIGGLAVWIYRRGRARRRAASARPATGLESALAPGPRG